MLSVKGISDNTFNREYNSLSRAWYTGRGKKGRIYMFRTQEANVRYDESFSCTCGATHSIGIFSESLEKNVANAQVYCAQCDTLWLLTEDAQAFSWENVV